MKKSRRETAFLSWFHNQCIMVYWTSFMAGNAAAWQPTMLVPVVVTAMFAKIRPVKAPPVKVIDPPTVSPARMLPLNVEVVMVAATLGTQYTLQGCPPPQTSPSVWQLIRSGCPMMQWQAPSTANTSPAIQTPQGKLPTFSALWRRRDYGRTDSRSKEWVSGLSF